MFESPAAPNLEKELDESLRQGELITYDGYINKLHPKDDSEERDPDLA